MDGRVRVLAVGIDRLTWAELLQQVDAALAAGRRLTLAYANAHVVNQAVHHAELAAAIERADLVYCDGEGVRLAARLLGDPLPDRMTGADFLPELMARLAAREAGVYWLGGPEGVAADALRRLRDTVPSLRVCGTHHGHFPDAGSEDVVARVNASGARVLFVGMGTPRQELWVAAHRAALAPDVVWCIGATAEFVAGTKQRGPRLFAAHGFEWLGRLLSEPRRLFARYVFGLPLFFARVLRAAALNRFAR